MATQTIDQFAGDFSLELKKLHFKFIRTYNCDLPAIYEDQIAPTYKFLLLKKSFDSTELKEGKFCFNTAHKISKKSLEWLCDFWKSDDVDIEI